MGAKLLNVIEIIWVIRWFKDAFLANKSVIVIMTVETKQAEKHF